MKINLVYFAIYADLLAKREETYLAKEGQTILDVFLDVTKGINLPNDLKEHTLFALNEDYVEGSEKLKEGDELVFIPPVSGG